MCEYVFNSGIWNKKESSMLRKAIVLASSVGLLACCGCVASEVAELATVLAVLIPLLTTG